MRADILPLLAKAASVDLTVATKAFERARTKALKRNNGLDDSRTFVLTVEGFRAACPFDLGALHLDRGVMDGPDTPASAKPE